MTPPCLVAGTLLLLFMASHTGTGSGIAPHIHIDHAETKGLKLTCTSTGWYPEPEVQWRDLQGQHFSPASEKKTPERSGLFHVESSIILDESSERNVACYIRNPVLSVEKEVHISVTDALFPRVSPWPIVIPVMVVLLIIIGIICVLLMRARKSKGSLESRYGALEGRFGSLESRYDSLEERYGSLKRRYGALERWYGSLYVAYDKISGELDRRKLVGKEGLNKVQIFAAEDIKLDRTTAHAYLSVSDDEKRVTSVPEKQNVPDDPAI